MQKFVLSMLLIVFCLTLLPLQAQQKEEGIVFAYARLTGLNTLRQEALPLLNPLKVTDKELKKMVAKWEEAFAFLGKGGIDWNQPIGVFFVYGHDYTKEQIALFAFPVKEGYGLITSLDQNPKAEKVDGVPNARKIGPVYFFRIPGYFLFGANREVFRLTEKTIWKTFQSDSSLCSAYLDGRELAQKYPKLVKEFLNQIAQAKLEEQSHKSPAQLAGYKFGQDITIEAMHEIAQGQCSMAVSKTKDSLQLRFYAQCAKNWEIKLSPAKGLPQDVMFHMYLNSTEWVNREFLPLIIDGIREEILKKEEYEEEHRESLEKMIQNFGDVCKASKNFSLGLHYDGKKGTFFFIKENPNSINTDIQLIREFIERATSLEKEKDIEIQPLDQTQMGNITPSVPGILISSLKGDGNIAFFQIGSYTYVVGSQGNVDFLYRAIKQLEGPGCNLHLGNVFVYRISVGYLAKHFGDSVRDPSMKKFIKSIPIDTDATFKADVFGNTINGTLSVPLSIFQPSKKPK